jgi:ABC-type uncharacterized transport system permease subunit
MAAVLPLVLAIVVGGIILVWLIKSALDKGFTTEDIVRVLGPLIVFTMILAVLLVLK